MMLCVSLDVKERNFRNANKLEFERPPTDDRELIYQPMSISQHSVAGEYCTPVILELYCILFKFSNFDYHDVYSVRIQWLLNDRF